MIEKQGTKKAGSFLILPYFTLQTVIVDYRLQAAVTLPMQFSAGSERETIRCACKMAPSAGSRRSSMRVHDP